ncbi:MAG TPA: hypothetical protein VFE57_11380 [Cyclobacteriaceae bacterium]|nr:hypothetical protein [Cyclobacteriaceae bacterium]
MSIVKKSIHHKVFILVSLILVLSQMAICQKKNTTESSPTLSMYDTLSTEEMTKTHSISNSTLPDLIKLEPGKVELYYKGTKFATIPPELREKINPKYIDSIEFEMDSLNSGKPVRNIQLYLNYRTKGKFSVKDYK